MIWNRKNPYLAEISKSHLLSGQKSNREIRHYEIELRNSKIIYEPGDSLGVIPQNNHELVNSIISRVDVSPSMIPSGYNITLFQLLKNNFEILTPTNRLIYFFNENITHHQLNDIISTKDKELLLEFKFGKDILDFMNLDKNFKIDLNIFLTLLKPLQHRAYSISSSSLIYPNQIHLTVSTDRWKNHSRNYGGVCSTFLSDICSKGSKIKIFLIPNKSFKLPKDQSKPIIMIGPGTGVAPFISFLQERKASESTGQNWLFFGAQTKDTDYLYNHEIDQLQRDGVIQKISLAFSRDQKEKIYVQDKMYEARSDFFQWIENGAYLYVCGDAYKMAKDVDLMLHKIIRLQLNCSYEESKNYVKNLKNEKRYLLDVY
jgi:sulfite reductase (NADPH) flavoprotein alpha-component